MGTRLEELLAKSEGAAPGSALQRARNAAAEELARKKPIRRWRAEMRWILLASWGTVLVVAAVAILSGISSWALLASRLPLFAILTVTGALCAYAALSPKAGRVLRWAAVGTAVSSGAILVLARRATERASETPDWVCTVSHLALGIPPLLLIVAFLRNAAPGRLRGAVAGLAVGTTGVLVGELACGQSALHVAAYHLTAWSAVAIAAVVATLLQKPTAYAP